MSSIVPRINRNVLTACIKAVNSSALSSSEPSEASKASTHARIARGERQQLAQLGEQLPQQVALALVEPQQVAALAREHAAWRQPGHAQSCRMVAQRPCSCRRKTSS